MKLKVINIEGTKVNDIELSIAYPIPSERLDPNDQQL